MFFIQLSSALADPDAVFTGKKRIARTAPSSKPAAAVAARKAWGVGGEGTKKESRVTKEESCGLPRPKLPLAIGS